MWILFNDALYNLDLIESIKLSKPDTIQFQHVDGANDINFVFDDADSANKAYSYLKSRLNVEPWVNDAVKPEIFEYAKVKTKK